MSTKTEAAQNLKLLRFQRQRAYQHNLNRIEAINRRRNQSIAEYLNSRQHKSLTGYQLEEVRQREIENHRLMRKLSQIGKRKSDYFYNDEEQDRFLTINRRAREQRRHQQQSLLQEANDNLVERIVSKLSRQSSIKDIEGSRVKVKNKRHNNHSLILPKMLIKQS